MTNTHFDTLAFFKTDFYPDKEVDTSDKTLHEALFGVPQESLINYNDKTSLVCFRVHENLDNGGFFATGFAVVERSANWEDSVSDAVYSAFDSTGKGWKLDRFGDMWHFVNAVPMDKDWPTFGDMRNDEKTKEPILTNEEQEAFFRTIYDFSFFPVDEVGKIENKFSDICDPQVFKDEYLANEKDQDY